MSERKQRRGFIEKIMHKIDIPCDAAPGNMYLELICDRDVIVGGCTGISEYFSDKVTLCGGNVSISVSGSGLELFSFTDDRVKISGTVENISIKRGV